MKKSVAYIKRLCSVKRVRTAASVTHKKIEKFPRILWLSGSIIFEISYTNLLSHVEVEVYQNLSKLRYLPYALMLYKLLLLLLLLLLLSLLLLLKIIVEQVSLFCLLHDF